MDATPKSRDDIAALLRRHDINPTHQRVEIAQVLLERGEHLSADQIIGLVNASYAETSKATVYNTLKLFLDKKLIRELIIDPDKVVYDPNITPHHHFYDVVSGRLTDIPAEQIQLGPLPAAPQGSVTESVDIIIRTRPAE